LKVETSLFVVHVVHGPDVLITEQYQYCLEIVGREAQGELRVR